MKFITLLLWVCLAISAPGEQQIIDDPFLDHVRAKVLTNHPALTSARHREKAAQAGVSAIRYWEDPTVGIAVAGADSDMRRNDGDVRLGLEQALPRRASARARQNKARAEVQVREADTKTLMSDLALIASRLVIELGRVDEAHVLEKHQLHWLRTMSTNATERLSAPKSSVAEALRLESEVALGEQRLESLKRDRQQWVEQLNVLAGQALSTPWPTLLFPSVLEAQKGVDAELKAMVVSNPSLEVLRRSYDSATSEWNLTQQERRPQFFVGIDAGFHSEKGRFRDSMVGLKMTLPWLNRSTYLANEERALGEAAAIEQEILVRERELRALVIKFHTQAVNAASQSGTLSREVIPKLRLAAESVESAWVASTATLMEVLEARRKLVEVEMQERGHLAQHREALEELKALIPR